MKWALYLALLVTAAAWARDAHAQDAAQAQFDLGLSEMRAGHYATACPALAESQRLDPRPGVLFTLAECESRWGKLGTALSHYEAYLAMVAHMGTTQREEQAERVTVATAQRETLRREVPELTVVLGENVPPGTVVTRDDLVLDRAALGVPVPLDPGDYRVSARTPEGRRVEERVTLARGDRRHVVLAFAAPPPPLPAPPAAPPAPQPAPDRPKPQTTAPARDGMPAPKIAGLFAMGLGGLFIGAWAISGVDYLSKQSRVHEDAGNLPTNQDLCATNPDGSLRASQACNDLHTAQDARTRTWILAGGALVTMVTGTVLVATAPKRAPTLSVGAAPLHGGGSIVLGGAF